MIWSPFYDGKSIITLTACYDQHENNSQYEELHHSVKQTEEEKRLKKNQDNSKEY